MYAGLPNFDSNPECYILDSNETKFSIISSLETSNFTIYLTSPYPYKARFLLLVMNAHSISWRIEALKRFINDLFMTLAY